MSLRRIVLGRSGEQRAKKLLEKKGYKILEQNYRTRFGEIDLIATDGDQIIFVEVKTRSSNRFGYPEESVTRQKITHLMRAAEQYILGLNEMPKVRFDVIAITEHDAEQDMVHIENIDLSK